MNQDYKIVRDSIYGDIKIEGIFLDIIRSPEIQRLYNIKQLGFAHLVFPGAHHTRLEHSLGTYYMAKKSGDILEISDDDKKNLTVAAFLHDVGHGPFSHTLESLLRESLNISHVDISEKIILGEFDIFNNSEKKYVNSPNLCELLDKHGIDKKKVNEIIKGRRQNKQFLSDLLVSVIDVDQLDYLTRDSYYTGVAYGLIDTDRYLQTLKIFNDNLMIERKGIGVVENILMARSLMYSSVYFHKTVRIAELMLSKAIEKIDDINPYDLFKMTDDELINFTKKTNDYSYEIITRLKYRNLYKQAYNRSHESLKKDEINHLKKLEDPDNRRQKEREIEEKLNIPEGHLIIDIPYQELHFSEPRIDKTDIKVYDEGEIRKIDELTPITSAIRSRYIPDWHIMVITDEKYRDIVSSNIGRIIFS